MGDELVGSVLVVVARVVGGAGHGVALLGLAADKVDVVVVVELGVLVGGQLDAKGPDGLVGGVAPDSAAPTPAPIPAPRRRSALQRLGRGTLQSRVDL